MLEKHLGKTFIDRAERGFSFLGYHLTPEGITVARTTVDNMIERIARLYEQGAGTTGIGQYVRRWGKGVSDGLGSVDLMAFQQCTMPEIRDTAKLQPIFKFDRFAV